MADAPFPTRWKDDKPPSIEEFTRIFRDDYACADYLYAKRWPDGFVCPHCGSRKGWRLESRPWLWECAGQGDNPKCRRQTSLIAGTVMQGTHLPLRKWFLAAYLMATHSNGISALQLQPKIDVTYKTAWLLLHKLRRAMVNPERTPLSGNVDVDETIIPFGKKRQAEPKGGSSPVGQIFVIGAVERVGNFGVGRIRLKRLEARSRKHIHPFLLENTAPGTKLRTDRNESYVGIPDRTLTQINLSKAVVPAHIHFKWIHVVFSNLKKWGLGTFHGFRDKHLDAYLNEFVFRWNRRRRFESAVSTMLGIGQSIEPITYRDIVGDTSEWREAHRDQILSMVHPTLRERAMAIVEQQGGDILEVIDELRAARPRVDYPRRRSRRPALPRRRSGEIRVTGRYSHPPRIPEDELRQGYLRHIPRNSPLLHA